MRKQNPLHHQLIGTCDSEDSQMSCGESKDSDVVMPIPLVWLDKRGGDLRRQKYGNSVERPGSSRGADRLNSNSEALSEAAEPEHSYALFPPGGKHPQRATHRGYRVKDLVL